MLAYKFHREITPESEKKCNFFIAEPERTFDGLHQVGWVQVLSAFQQCHYDLML